MSLNNVSNVLGKEKSREEVLQEIKSNIAVYPIFLDLKRDYQEQFIEFCMGIRGVKMTYDNFFKYIFNAEVHPERLSKMLSAILGRPLKVKRALPVEHMRITEKGSLLILDIIVEFDTGELADVEIQKIGYLFPGQRAACYSADMLMRQYEREKSIRGEDFTYKDLKKVYTIVFIENSSKEFWENSEQYVHCGKVVFDTGVRMEMLQEFYFFPLDIFFHIQHNKSNKIIENELEAWLYFLGSDRTEDIIKLIDAYPEFEELYKDICQFRCQPEVAIMMFSEALRKMDENTVKYMIEEQKKEIEENKRIIEQNKKIIGEQEGKIEKQTEEIEKQTEEIEKQTEKIEKQTEEIEKQTEEIEKKTEEIEKQAKEIREQAERIAELERLLAEKR